MGAEPEKKRGTKKKAYPYSMSSLLPPNGDVEKVEIH